MLLQSSCDLLLGCFQPLSALAVCLISGPIRVEPTWEASIAAWKRQVMLLFHRFQSSRMTLHHLGQFLCRRAVLRRLRESVAVPFCMMLSALGRGRGTRCPAQPEPQHSACPAGLRCAFSEVDLLCLIACDPAFDARQTRHRCMSSRHCLCQSFVLKCFHHPSSVKRCRRAKVSRQALVQFRFTQNQFSISSGSLVFRCFALVLLLLLHTCEDWSTASREACWPLLPLRFALLPSSAGTRGLCWLRCDGPLPSGISRAVTLCSCVHCQPIPGCLCSASCNSAFFFSKDSCSRHTADDSRSLRLCNFSSLLVLYSSRIQGRVVLLQCQLVACPEQGMCTADKRTRMRCFMACWEFRQT